MVKNIVLIFLITYKYNLRSVNMEDIIEITVSEKGTDNLIVHIFEDDEGLKIICDRNVDVNVQIKNSPCEESEFSN